MWDHVRISARRRAKLAIGQLGCGKHFHGAARRQNSVWAKPRDRKRRPRASSSSEAKDLARRWCKNPRGVGFLATPCTIYFRSVNFLFRFCCGATGGRGGEVVIIILKIYYLVMNFLLLFCYSNAAVGGLCAGVHKISGRCIAQPLIFRLIRRLQCALFGARITNFAKTLVFYEKR